MDNDDFTKVKRFGGMFFGHNNTAKRPLSKNCTYKYGGLHTQVCLRPELPDRGDRLNLHMYEPQQNYIFMQAFLLYTRKDAFVQINCTKLCIEIHDLCRLHIYSTRLQRLQSGKENKRRMYKHIKMFVKEHNDHIVRIKQLLYIYRSF